MLAIGVYYAQQREGYILTLFILRWTKKDGSSKCKYENPKRVLIAFVLIAFLNFVIFISETIRNGIMEDGVLGTHCMNLFCGLMFLVLFAVLLLKRMQSRREAE